LTRGRSYEAPDRVIDAQISRLRKKIEAGKHPASLIKSVRGVGYVFTGQASERANCRPGRTGETSGRKAARAF